MFLHMYTLLYQPSVNDICKCTRKTSAFLWWCAHSCHPSVFAIFMHPHFTKKKWAACCPMFNLCDINLTIHTGTDISLNTVNTTHIAPALVCICFLVCVWMFNSLNERICMVHIRSLHIKTCNSELKSQKGSKYMNMCHICSVWVFKGCGIGKYNVCVNLYKLLIIGIWEFF